MNLKNKQWFIITCFSMLKGYTEEELETLWKTFNIDQLDFIKELCQVNYNAGYKAAEEDR